MDRLSRICFFCGVGFLLILTGLLMAAFNTAPYGLVKEALLAVNSFASDAHDAEELYYGHNWQTNASSAKGVSFESLSDVSPGFTLYGSGQDTRVALLNLNAQEVHSWNAPFQKVWPNISVEKPGTPTSRVHVRRAHVFPNGDLLAEYVTTYATPYGAGLAKLDRNSEVVWKFDGNCHHDFCVNNDGEVFVLTHEFHPSNHPQSVFGNKPNIEDYVAILSSDGKHKKTFSLLDAFLDSPWFRKDIHIRDQFGDILHANTINLVETGFAANYSEIDPGDLMICFRNLCLVVVVDPESEKIVWALNGPWFFPHDPDPLPNGNVLIFDNCVTRGSQICSRVIEFNPRTSQIEWEYCGTEDDILRSDLRSTQQLLPNGNVLIAESDGGRILEVNRAGNIVWQFVNPVRGGDSDNCIPIMTAVRRYTSDELPFIESNLRPQVSIREQ